MLYSYTIKTTKEEFRPITDLVRDAILKSGVTDGLCLVFCPHTTAAITINENADPDVTRDLLVGFSAAFPDRSDFRHMEGNSAAHLKASTIGASELLIVEGGAPLLGRWQGVYFCEFDGPRTRTFYVKVTRSLEGNEHYVNN
ncbi:secondary thiamine-phosphate synthase enzyme YjbQ [Oscillospiraceae bacterium OttesenSCG-928-G22]|nr:secondary thiamine-phosphate synthase enzyme YjbQ [Oscillospiraceae bacterium OttesenSCG-928-G22]